MGKKDEGRPRCFFGRNGRLEDMLEELRWEVAADEVLKKRQEECRAASPPAAESYKEDKKYKTG